MQHWFTWYCSIMTNNYSKKSNQLSCSEYLLSKVTETTIENSVIITHWVLVLTYNMSNVWIYVVSHVLLTRKATVVKLFVWLSCMAKPLIKSCYAVNCDCHNPYTNKCMRAYTCTHTLHTHTHTRACGDMHAHTYMCMHVHMHAHMHGTCTHRETHAHNECTCARTHTHTQCMCTHTHTHTFTHMPACIHTHTYFHKHAHTYIYTDTYSCFIQTQLHEQFICVSI